MGDQSFHNNLISKDKLPSAHTEKTTVKEYGRLVAAKRDSLGLSQAMLARLLGKHVTYISKIERGLYVPNLKVASQLATLLQEDTREFLRLTFSAKSETGAVDVQIAEDIASDAPAYTSKEQALISRYRMLTPEGREYIERSIQMALLAERGADADLSPEPTKIRSHRAQPRTRSDEDFPRSPELNAAQVISSRSPVLAVDEKERHKKRTNEPTHRSKAIYQTKAQYVSGDQAGAIRTFEEIVTGGDLVEKDLREIVNFLLQKNEKKVAKSLISRSDLKEADSLILLARIHEKEGNITKSIQILNDYLNRKKNDSSKEEKVLVRLADLYCQSGNKKNAKEILVDLSRTTLASQTLRRESARIAIDLDEYDLAQSLLEPLLSSKSERHYGLHLLALLQLKTENFQDLSTTGKELIATRPSESPGYLFAAMAAFFRKDAEDLAGNLEKSLRAEMTYSVLVPQMCEYLLDAGISPKRVLPVLLRFRDSGDELLFDVLARSYWQNSQPTEAIETAKDGMRRFPESELILNALAWMYLAREEYREVDSLLEARIGSDSQNAGGSYILGKSKLAQSDFVTAEVLLRRVLTSNPTWLQARTTLSDALRKQGNLAEAKKVLLEAPDESGKSGILNFYLGRVLLEERAYVEAAAAFEKGIKTNPEDGTAWYLLGYSLVRAGRYGDGVNAFKHTIALNGEDANAWNGVGYALNMAGSYQDALQPLQTALDKANSSAEKAMILSNLAHSYVKLDRLEEAITSIRRSLDLDREWAEAHYNYGLILIALKDFEKATLEFKEAVRLDEDGACTEAAKRRMLAI